MDMLKAVQKAIETGEVLDVIYLGGSQPGKHRKLYPRKIDGNLIYALCLETNRVKSFSLKKMAPFEQYIAGNGDDAAEYDSELATHLAEATSFSDAMEPHVKALKEKGWGVAIDDDSISLHRFFKSGKQKKKPVVILMYQHENSLKPWYINSETMSMAKSFGHFYKAALLFLQNAEECEP